jgi:hypothetical protein
VELVDRLSCRERRFRQLRILVRWHGGWVEPGKLRESLIGMVEGFSAKVRELAEGPGDQLDAVDRVAGELVRKPGRSRAQRMIRHRLEGKDLDRLAFALVALGLGAEVEWDNHDLAAEELGCLPAGATSAHAQRKRARNRPGPGGKADARDRTGGLRLTMEVLPGRPIAR